MLDSFTIEHFWEEEMNLIIIMYLIVILSILRRLELYFKIFNWMGFWCGIFILFVHFYWFITFTSNVPICLYIFEYLI